MPDHLSETPTDEAHSPRPDKSEALLPPSPLACQPPVVTCQPATEPDTRSLHFTATKSNTLRPYPLLSPTKPNRIRPCSSPIRRIAVHGLTSAMSDNIRSPVVDTVYRSFGRSLENNHLHSLWIGLDRVVPREVFRRLGLREPFPRPTSAPSKLKTTPMARFATYARPADQNLKFLNEKERAELEAVQKVKEEHALAILIAQRKEKEAAETALYLQQTFLLRREKEALVQREEELAKSSAARRLAAKAPEPYVPSPIVRPAVLQIQALPDIPSQTGPSTSAPDALLITPERSSKSAKSSKSRSSSTRSRKETPGETPRSSKESRGRTSSSERVLAKQFKKHGIHTSEDEEAALKSPTSPYSA
ncbi:hypothetical protein OUZ56_003374 [Daphnia magna]|uniref:TPX2 C-terminal domain-containing protein n=1 Tax=Daphnia magna TaxID=35525 RepID=A0ABR0A8U4_9CRUS|nr:hypothetical protein OUZ56_003374 [Daphnia magna]